MDDLPLIESIVKTLAEGLTIPVTVKIRIFEDVERTVAYARMIEDAGAYLLAVHGRTREQKWARDVRASWDHIKVCVQGMVGGGMRWYWYWCCCCWWWCVLIVHVFVVLVPLYFLVSAC